MTLLATGGMELVGVELTIVAPQADRWSYSLPQSVAIGSALTASR